MKVENKAFLLKKATNKIKRASSSKLKEVIEIFKLKEQIEYEAIQGVFKSKETGKIHTIIYRRKVKPYSAIIWDEAGNYSKDEEGVK